MTTTTNEPQQHLRRTIRRGRGDDGTAVLEFALVGVLLFTLVFGLISFGWLLSFRGSMQQSASEAARAGAAAPRDLAATTSGRNNTIVLSRATLARDNALKGYGKTCSSTAVTCTTSIADCSSTTGADTAALPDCITVKISYDNKAKPYPVAIPLISSIMPRTITVSSTEELNDR